MEADFGMGAFSEESSRKQTTTPGRDRSDAPAGGDRPASSTGTPVLDGAGADDGTMATMTTHSGRSSATGPASHEASQEAFADLVQQVELAGYYPELVLDTLRLATGEEEILSGMVQSETTFAEAVHRHLTVLALTPSRLIIVHVRRHPSRRRSPGALATSEAVPLSRIRSMALTRGVADPARGRWNPHPR